ncbi:hypothetical protein PV682_01505 [Streptomyces niveiscabiei]|uniref:hypothetical protein n=1 Tax=Streptomyces niveiscabiei TaxID=164115 RepID=UPI0029A1E1DE|nr:hypothetical protein [Streptomyces niveiscabiei]MDX3380122.1 hypothetical protein [Streptomyces niveiscabiei]
MRGRPPHGRTPYPTARSRPLPTPADPGEDHDPLDLQRQPPLQVGGDDVHVTDGLPAPGSGPGPGRTGAGEVDDGTSDQYMGHVPGQARTDDRGMDQPDALFRHGGTDDHAADRHLRAPTARARASAAVSWEPPRTRPLRPASGRPAGVRGTGTLGASSARGFTDRGRATPPRPGPHVLQQPQTARLVHTGNPLLDSTAQLLRPGAGTVGDDDAGTAAR